MFEQEDEWVSKTQMKKQMNDLQALGMELTKLSSDTLKKIGLDEELFEAIATYKKITSNSALKRQAQFIGRLMRDTDPAPIEAYLANCAATIRRTMPFCNALSRRVPDCWQTMARLPNLWPIFRKPTPANCAP